MKKTSYILLSFFLCLTGCSKKLTVKSQELNLDFEQSEQDFPKNWSSLGSDDYKIYLDSIKPKNGKYSAVIENKGDSIRFKALSIVLPDNYKGKTIRLSGYIKTENVRDGFAGLWMKIDPKIAFDNMANKGITGTTDWKEYEITLSLSPEKTEKIFIGGLLVGKGKMWLDDLQVTIDGKSLEDPKLELWGTQADRDRDFNNGSNIKIPKLSDQNIDNLELLGRIWGFMKYYHPNIAKGEYNWDFELFRILPGYLTVKNNLERDKLLEAWIEKFGSLLICKTCKQAANSAKLKPDLGWIEKSNISQNLQKVLKYLYNNRNQGEHYYISLDLNVGNPNFKNEKLYSDMPYPDDGFRLLSLFRYWNMIQYFFPYKYLTDNDWNIVLKKYIPIFLHAKNELEYELATLRIIAEINDTHGKILSGGDKIQKLRGDKFAPFKTEFVENNFVVTNYLKSNFPEMAKLKKGDIITHINGKTIEYLIDSLRCYYPHSNEISMLRDISEDLLRSSDSTIQINYTSSNQHNRTNIRLYDYKDLNVDAWHQERKKQPTFKLLMDSIGYLTLENVEFGDVDELKNVLGDLKGLVIDIRSYPNKFVALQLASLFISHQTEFVKFSKATISNPGEFNFSRGIVIEPQKYNYSNNNRKPFAGKLVILVNETSQSQAEYTAMALRAVPNSLIIGNTTAGADGNASYINLPGGISTLISGIGIYYPDGRETQRIGIIPDITVKQTINGIKEGKDEVLEKAIKILIN